MSAPVDLGGRNFRDLGLSDEVVALLQRIVATTDQQYRERFVEMAQALNRQAATLDRIQATLAILVENAIPDQRETTPIAFRVAGANEETDVATAFLTPDPIGAGFTLSQVAVATALGIPDTHVSNLIRGWRLRDDADLAVQVRMGKRNPLYNYHPRIVERLHRQIEESSPLVDKKLLSAWKGSLAIARSRLGYDED